MADVYEIFDSGHHKRVSRHQLLNAKQVNQVMVALRSLRLDGVAEARISAFERVRPPHHSCYGTV